MGRWEDGMKVGRRECGVEEECDHGGGYEGGRKWREGGRGMEGGGWERRWREGGREGGGWREGWIREGRKKGGAIEWKLRWEEKKSEVGKLVNKTWTEEGGMEFRSEEGMREGGRGYKEVGRRHGEGKRA